MLNYVIKKLVKRYFNYDLNITIDDPYYDKIPVNNQKTRFKTIAKKLPDNLSINDLMILNKFQKRAYRYDMLFNYIGIPFGISAIIQLIPFIGSIITTYQSLTLIWLLKGLDNGVPPDILVYCLFNILIDLLLGLIPIIGDLITVSYKSNSRNYALVKNYLQQVSEYNNGNITLGDLKRNWFNNLFNWKKEVTYLRKNL